MRTEKASASLAHFGAECNTAQAPRSARSGRRRRRPRSRTSAPSVRRRRRQDRRDQDGGGVGLARALRRRVQDGAGAKIGAMRTEKASASLAHFGAECKTAQAPRSARLDLPGTALYAGGAGFDHGFNYGTCCI
ncbi:hypothetical protein PR003_g24040 [Phytophthora rubi]|uniref:Uncharacterized protein n=1 Tax=Phytophthora rubi TaxID=129364 RepID=A0A6A4CWY0_9STRA|nr:hypothetical protein PR001_g19167 [Phytophthora rubi]KAE9295344.1 hypothetical protein PR003_g24040 [Phytophthora rubi]